jgi:hypothetical protein
MAKANPKTRAKSKTAAKSTAKKAVKKAVKKAMKKAMKKAAKPTAKKVAKAAAKQPATKPATPTIVATALSRDGASCTVTLSSRQRVRMSAAAMHAARIRIGGRWTAATAARIERFEREQKLYAQALELLATDPRLTKAQLAERLGGGRHAEAAIESLVEHGWI